MLKASENLPSRGTILGFDFGLKRIGVASGELETRQAFPDKVLSCDSEAERFTQIGNLIVEWRPIALVVGVPCHLNGDEHQLTKRCRRFANQLRGRLSLPVFEIDERLSSCEAEKRLIDNQLANKTQRRTQLDAVAAQIILQQFLDSYTNYSSCES